jgi:hypothetical protein
MSQEPYEYWEYVHRQKRKNAFIWLLIAVGAFASAVYIIFA